MTPNEQRIAITSAFPNVFRRKAGTFGWCYWNISANRMLPCIDGDPLCDLNALHEMENTLDGSSLYDSPWCRYVHQLHKMTLGKGEHATAAQRAEAFLRTVGKWKDTP